MSLNEQILTTVQESGIADFDQRSALGMARSWIDNGKLDTWEEARHGQMPTGRIQYVKRDQLASDLVAVLEESGADEDEMVGALAEARRVINEPYLDPNMNGQRGAKPNFKKDKKDR